MIRRIIFALAIAAGVYAGTAALADELPAPSDNQAAEAGEAARLLKQKADALSEEGDKRGAAELYAKALDTSRGNFTEEERTDIAIRISWGDMFSRSIEELRQIVSSGSSNLRARIHLARVLSWSGDYAGSLTETEKVLAENPANREALAVKAAVLRWKGDYGASIAIYGGILSEKEDFDARLGLTYALIAKGEKKAAKKSMELLKPASSYEKSEYEKLEQALADAVSPTLEARYSYYNDTDSNQVRRYALGYGFRADNLRVDAKYVHTDGEDDLRKADADSLLLNGSYRLNGTYGVNAGIGYHLLSNSGRSSFVTGGVRAEANALGGAFGAAVSRDVLLDTARLIESGVSMTGYGVYARIPAANRLMLYGGISYRDYSDGNSAFELNLSPVYRVLKPVSAGYRFKYLDFDRQSGSGFFDPEGYVSNQVFVSVDYARGRMYSKIEPHAGHQSFTRYGEANSGFYAGGSAVLGYKAARGLLFEIDAEGGSSAIGTAAGFKYYMAGFKAVLTLY